MKYLSSFLLGTRPCIRFKPIRTGIEYFVVSERIGTMGDGMLESPKRRGPIADSLKASPGNNGKI